MFTLKDMRSEVYVLCGVAINKNHRDDLKILADQVKFKYWGHTNIVFHSTEIGKCNGVFTIFKKEHDLYQSFLKDLLMLLNRSKVFILPVVVDKHLAKAKGWNDIKILKETSDNLFVSFSYFLQSNPNFKGKIIVEAANANKDKFYMNSYWYLLSVNTSLSKKLTSISFVNKHNYDIEEQLSDIFAYAIKCKYLQLRNLRQFKKDSYEERLIKILDRKLFKVPNLKNSRKAEVLKKIEVFKVLPNLK